MHSTPKNIAHASHRCTDNLNHSDTSFHSTRYPSLLGIQGLQGVYSVNMEREVCQEVCRYTSLKHVLLFKFNLKENATNFLVPKILRLTSSGNQTPDPWCAEKQLSVKVLMIYDINILVIILTFRRLLLFCCLFHCALILFCWLLLLVVHRLDYCLLWFVPLFLYWFLIGYSYLLWNNDRIFLISLLLLSAQRLNILL